jgi:hypothetical protein
MQNAITILLFQNSNCWSWSTRNAAGCQVIWHLAGIPSYSEIWCLCNLLPLMLQKPFIDETEQHRRAFILSYKADRKDAWRMCSLNVMFPFEQNLYVFKYCLPSTFSLIAHVRVADTCKHVSFAIIFLSHLIVFSTQLCCESLDTMIDCDCSCDVDPLMGRLNCL